MKYANYIHACVQTLLVGKRHRVVHYKQMRNRVSVTHPLTVYKTARCSPHFANQNVNAHALRAVYIFHGKGLFCAYVIQAC